MNTTPTVSTSTSGRRHFFTLIGVAILLFLLAYSFSTLTTKPRLWSDEAKSLELARGFAKSGVLNIEYAPGQWTQKSELLQSTGYPVTVPLGMLFRLFGFNFPLARMYMILWMILALWVVYSFSRKSFDSNSALMAVLLVATFASFHDGGRTVVGEIPGFVFLFAGLYFAFERRSYVLSGLLLGLAMVTKPSVFGLLLPAIFLLLLWEPRKLLTRLFYFAVGMLPAALLWFALVPANPFSRTLWSDLFAFYRNPYSGNIASNVSTNLAHFFSSTTLIYFSALLLVLVVARFSLRRKETTLWYDFTFLYTGLAFLYYLRSPGWLRYLLIAELLILSLLPHALFTLLHTLQAKFVFIKKIHLATTTVMLVSVLVLVQMVQLFTVADIFESDRARSIASYLDLHYGDVRVAVLNQPDVFTLLENPRREVIFKLTGMPVIGKNPLRDFPLPEVVVVSSSPDDNFRNEAAEVLDREYRLATSSLGYDIFELFR